MLDSTSAHLTTYAQSTNSGATETIALGSTSGITQSAVLKDWDATGLSGAQYCREKAITYSQFRDWRIEIRKRDAEIQEHEQEPNNTLAVEENWRRIVAEWRRSGLTAAEYCRRKQIISCQFNNWKAKIDRIDVKVERAAQKALTRQRKLERVNQERKTAPPISKMDDRSIEFAEIKLIEHPQPTVEQNRSTRSQLAAIELIYFVQPLGRWTSRDPIGELGWSNTLRYANNNPINQRDPLGLYSSDRG